MRKERATMKDVAKLAGVSQPTVSYVINGTAKVSDAVRKRVQEAIEELGYQPNYFAKALKTQTSNLVGILVPDIINQYYARLLTVLDEILHDKGFEIIICSTSYDPARERNAVQRLTSINIYGIISVYQLTDEKCWDVMRDYHTKVVAIEGGSYCSNVGIPNITGDSHLGGYLATCHLIDRGCKRIAYIHQNANTETLEVRKNGYIDAMKSAGLYEPQNIFVTEVPNNIWVEGAVLGQRIAGMPFDGIVAATDVIAVGIIKALLSNGRRIPEDVAVVGYDNVLISELVIPPLTTVAQPINEMCAFAVEALTNDVQYEVPTPVTTLQPSLIKRGST